MLVTGQAKVALVCENLWQYCNEDDEYIYYMGLVYTENEMYEKALDCLLNCINREETKMPKCKSYYIAAEILNVCGLFAESISFYEKCNGYKDSKEKKSILENKMI